MASELRGKLSSPFEAAWTTSSQSNHLGRLVFLGPPFFRKRWVKRRWWSPRGLGGRLFDLAVCLAVGPILGFLWALCVLYLWWLTPTVIRELFGIGPPPWPPAAWPFWLKASQAVFSLVFSFSLFAATLERRRQDANAYFDETRVARPDLTRDESAQQIVPIETLIISAGLLDEVLFAFSSEPLVYAALVPQMRAVMYPRVIWSPTRPRIGQDPLLPHKVIGRSVMAGARLVRSLVLYCVRPGMRWWERRLTNRLLQIISAPTFGLPPEEFLEAMIVPSNRLEMADFFRERSWDVSELLAASPPVRWEPGGERLGRYAFLWRDAELEARKEQSWLWQQTRGVHDEVRRRYEQFPAVDVQQAMRDLATTCVMLEERFKEMAGVVQLVHSSYHSHPAIVDAVARFIATGRAGPEGVVEEQMGPANRDEKGGTTSTSG